MQQEGSKPLTFMLAKSVDIRVTIDASLFVITSSSWHCLPSGVQCQNLVPCQAASSVRTASNLLMWRVVLADTVAWSKTKSGWSVMIVQLLDRHQSIGTMSSMKDPKLYSIYSIWWGLANVTVTYVQACAARCISTALYIHTPCIYARHGNGMFSMASRVQSWCVCRFEAKVSSEEKGQRIFTLHLTSISGSWLEPAQFAGGNGNNRGAVNQIEALARNTSMHTCFLCLLYLLLPNESMTTRKCAVC